MRSSFVAVLLGIASLASPTPLGALDELQALNDRAVAALQAVDRRNRRSATCSLATAHVRKDWASMTVSERKAYIKAVQCIRSKPARTDSALAPGVKTRYDDFVAVHINSTRTIHGTGNFLSWHRYFLWNYEEALRSECNYDGYQPYWNWFANVEDLTKSPVFDGSETSMGGDGVFVKHNGSIAGAGNIVIPSGTGGGCVKSGPFKDVQANLGPNSPAMDGMTAVQGGLLAYNPRCVRRDLSAYTASKWLTVANLLNITVGDASKNILLFQNELQGRFGDDGSLGMHGGGHVAVGGDHDDLYSSPVDPVFWLHHSMLDRVWWIWQALHPSEAETIAGTITILNRPPSRDASLDDLLNLGIIAPSMPIRNGLNTLADKYCYIYV